MKEQTQTNEQTIKQRLTHEIRRELSREEPETSAPADTDRFTYTVTDQDVNMTVKLILKKRLGFSKRLLIRLKQGEGKVTRNGRKVRLFADVIAGDVIQAELPAERCHFIPQDIPIEAVYEDQDMLVINKQPWVVVHPTMGHPTGTIANGLMKRMEERGEHFKIRFVNRLDRDTSGLMMVAKNSHCQDVMTKQMKSDSVTKKYLAVVHGIIKEEAGTVDLPIGRKEPEDIRRCVMEDGYPSVTHYKVLRRFPEKADTPEWAAGGFTLLELRLETGRTHQIRVHMSHVGHPLAGDPLYGRQEPELIGRQALHAASLRFVHPVSGETVELAAPLPDDMEQLIQKLK